jgi:hypothetical protein
MTFVLFCGYSYGWTPARESVDQHAASYPGIVDVDLAIFEPPTVARPPYQQRADNERSIPACSETFRDCQLRTLQDHSHVSRLDTLLCHSENRSTVGDDRCIYKRFPTACPTVEISNHFSPPITSLQIFTTMQFKWILALVAFAASCYAEIFDIKAWNATPITVKELVDSIDAVTKEVTDFRATLRRAHRREATTNVSRGRISSHHCLFS